MTERRAARGADPRGAAVVPVALLLKPLLKQLLQRLRVKRLEQGLLFGRQVGQPLLRVSQPVEQLVFKLRARRVDALKVLGEGEDEFSTMSLDPERRTALKARQNLKPGAPGEREEVQVSELRATNTQGVVGFLRKIFAK